MSKLNLCDQIDAYMLVKETKTVANTAPVDAAVNNVDKTVIFKNGAPFIKCISRINNIQLDDAMILMK